jgi:hypothetical protein
MLVDARWHFMQSFVAFIPEAANSSVRETHGIIEGLVSSQPF